MLNALNFRNGSLRVGGEIKVNGQLIESSDALSSISGYVLQDDLFIGTLKVREWIVFQAMLKMDKNTDLEERERRIEEVLLYVTFYNSTLS